ncbi:MAG: phosphatidylinositol-specific phospholipase C [Eggerthellaceae bacterium]|nr:phosphatidylinositol-specific phospholipase C [Eggerthellaceae bacterium]
MTRVTDMSSPHAQQEPHGRTVSRRGRHARRRRGLRIFVGIVGSIFGVILLAVAALLIIPLTETGDATPVEGSDSWMAQLPDETPLSRVVIPGTHDSATQYCQLAFITKCQALSIAGQLDAGFRYLDIRLGDDGNGGLQLFHGFTHAKTGVFGGNLTLEAVLADCYAFLDAHPTETIIICVKQEHGEASVADFQRLLDAQVQANPDEWLLTDTLPTVGEARGKLVLMRRYDDEAGLGAAAGIPALWAGQGGHDDTKLHLMMEDNGSYTLWVQDRYEYDADDKWTAFLGGMVTAAMGAEPGDVALHFLSTKGTFVQGHPYGFAKKLNAHLMGLETDAITGWVIVDFGSAPIAEHIYLSNFTE